MCRDATARKWARLPLAVWLLGGSCALAQLVNPAPRTLLPDWRRLGNSSYDALLASAATGPVDRVWFSADGDHLFIRTASGSFFETSDFESWKPAPGLEPPEKDAILARSLPTLPEPNAQARAADGFYARLYAFGRQVYRSEDGGLSWVNRTASHGESIIGNGVYDLAVSPLDPDAVVAVTGFGVWRSIDGGLSWYGLNDTLPNLPVRSLLSAPDGSRGTRVLLESGTALEWEPGERQSWRTLADRAAEQESAPRSLASLQVGESITALASAGDTTYAGAVSGALWVSRDRGATWRRSRLAAGNPIEAIFALTGQPGQALAVLADPGGEGAHPRVLRTVDGGFNWEDLSGDLPPGSAWGVTADPGGTAIYVAADRGVFLSVAGPGLARLGEHWIPMSENLPAVPVRDVKLNETGYQIYVAVAGYGVYAAPAPHRFLNVEVANAADFSQRPAAPGSLLTVLGGRLIRAQAGLVLAPVLHASDTQSQLQIPFELSGPSPLLSLELSQGRLTLKIPLREVSPAIFVDREGGAMLMDGDSGVLLDALTPAHSGSRVQILATGLGRVSPAWPTGVAAPLQAPPRVVVPVRAYLNGTPLEVTRATLAPGYVGWYLVEIRLPSVVDSGPAELFIEAGGQESNRVRIHLEL
jgi:uncharacterized protein (TIGR03437 family)